MKTVQQITDTANARIDAGVLPELQTQQQKDEYINKEIVKEMKAFLTSTDWIVAKIGEALIKGQDTAPLMSQYQSDLSDRETARAAINTAEGDV